MPLVIGAFTTLGEAEQATAALLDAGFSADAMTAVARAGGGRVLLARRVAVHAAGDPARLLNRSEQAGAAAVASGLAGGIAALIALALLPRLGLYAIPTGLLPEGKLATLIVVLAAGLACAALGALSRQRAGLPHDLAVRYAIRLDQGDTVLALAAGSGAQARAAQETLALHGALQAHVTRGTLAAAEDVAAPAYAPSVN